MTKTWPQMLKAYFGTTLTRDECDLWEDELARTFGDNLAQEEICEAIRWKSCNLDGGQFFRRPTLTDLRIWIYQWRRWNNAVAVEEDGCPYNCRAGWVSYHYLNGAHRAQMTAAVPCLCATGHKWHERYYKDDTAILEKSRIAIRQMENPDAAPIPWHQ